LHKKLYDAIERILKLGPKLQNDWWQWYFWVELDLRHETWQKTRRKFFFFGVAHDLGFTRVKFKKKVKVLKSFSVTFLYVKSRFLFVDLNYGVKPHRKVTQLCFLPWFYFKVLKFPNFLQNSTWFDSFFEFSREKKRHK
jgi:hypothetical protein